MIEIKGNFTQGRELMKSLRAETMKQIKDLEKKERKENYLKAADRNRYDSLQRQIPIYSVSQTIPAQMDGIIINSKLLQRFLKKLKGMQYESVAHGDKLCVHYGHRPNEYTGELELYDLSPYFKAFSDIPVLEVKQ